MSSVKHGSENSGRGLSGMWRDCPIAEIKENPNLGFYFFDDFSEAPKIGTTTSEVAVGSKYKCYTKDDGGVTFVDSVNSVRMNGCMALYGGNTDADNGAIVTVAQPVILTGLSASSGKMRFEARIATTQIATNDAQLFVGLGETDVTLADGVPLANTNAVTNTGAFIGFQRNEDGLGVLNTSYSDRATSWTDVSTSEATIAALTFVNVGIKYDPWNATKCISFYRNGVELATGISSSTLTGLTNLDANNLGMVAAIFNDTAGTSSYLYVKCWAMAQLAPGQ